MPSLGEPYLVTSGVHARLGDPSMFALPPEFEGESLDERIAHDPQAAALTLAILDLTDAVRELTARLNRPPWYVRLWRHLYDHPDETGV